MTVARALTLALVLAVASTPPSFAQGPEAEPRLSIAGGLLWSGGYDIGDRAAAIRESSLSPSPSGFTLFDTSSAFSSAAGLDARIGVALTPSVTVEAGFGWSRPQLDVTVENDVEATGVLIAGETVAQYALLGSVLWTPRRFASSALVPYAIAGGGYLRQLHDEDVAVETGQLYQVGGGVRYWRRGRDGEGWPIGLRAEARAMIRRSGIEFADRTRTYPAFSVLGVIGF